MTHGVVIEWQIFWTSRCPTQLWLAGAVFCRPSLRLPSLFCSFPCIFGCTGPVGFACFCSRMGKWKGSLSPLVWASPGVIRITRLLNLVIPEIECAVQNSDTSSFGQDVVCGTSAPTTCKCWTWNLEVNSPIHECCCCHLQRRSRFHLFLSNASPSTRGAAYPIYHWRACIAFAPGCSFIFYSRRTFRCDWHQVL